jgi:hypothetical protein
MVTHTWETNKSAKHIGMWKGKFGIGKLGQGKFEHEKFDKRKRRTSNLDPKMKEKLREKTMKMSGWFSHRQAGKYTTTPDDFKPIFNGERNNFKGNFVGKRNNHTNWDRSRRNFVVEGEPSGDKGA